VHGVHDWAEVHRLYQVEGMAEVAIAAKLGMSRTTVHRQQFLTTPWAALCRLDPTAR
jgi:hypothetical protein